MASLAVLAASAFGVFAETLNIGDPALKLQVSQWVQGEPVTDFKPGSAYFVEFWSGGSGPCLECVPFIDRIYGQYKDKGLKVVAIDAWQTNVASVETMLKQWSGRMNYGIAMDSFDGVQRWGMGRTASSWMHQAGESNVPVAFLINKESKVAWIGHPTSLSNKIIDETLAGTLDLKKVASDRQKEFEIINNPEVQKVWEELKTNANDKQWDKAGTNIERLEKLTSAKPLPTLGLYHVVVDFGKKNFKEGVERAAKLGAENNDNASLLNALAWEVLNEGGEKPDLDVAVKLSQRACDLTCENEPRMLVTLARIYFLKGDQTKAVEKQTKAVVLTMGRAKEAFEKTLENYKAGQLPK